MIRHKIQFTTTARVPVWKICITAMMFFLFVYPAEIVGAQQSSSGQDSLVQLVVLQDKEAEQMRITMQVKDVPLPVALEALAEQLRVGLSYHTDVMPDKRVTLDMTNVLVFDVLYKILEGTSLEAVLPPSRDVIVIREKEQVLPEEKIYQETITGRVTDAQTGEALPGVNVVVAGSEEATGRIIGTQTDLDGNYSINVPEGLNTLAFTYIGYSTLEVGIDGRSEVDIELQQDIQMLDDVVVIGYGTVRKSDLTGSVSSIQAEEITATPTLRVDDALRGRVAGFRAVPTSSQPGAATSIRIRGSNSISANNEPLFVVDGMIGGFSLNEINVNDIESVEVLKDASATAIYGARGSNGVVLITTKRGLSGEPRISYHTNASFQSPTRFIPMLNAEQFAGFMNEVRGTEIYENPSSFGDGTSWQREVWRDNALTHNHSLSVSGGSASNRYFISGNYVDQEGIGLNSNLNRYNLRVNTDHELNRRLKIGNSLLISKINNVHGAFSGPGEGVLNTVGWLPTLPVVDDDGNPTIQIASPELSNDNPVTNAIEKFDEQTTQKLAVNIHGEYKLLQGLVYRLSLGANIEEGKRERYLPSTFYTQRNINGTATINNNNSTDILVENTLRYAGDFGNHRLDGVVGYTRQTITTESNMVEARGFVTDAFMFNNLGAAAERSGANSNVSEEGLESYLARANYSYQDKYLFTISGRLDGASVFARNNKWGFFPSVAVAWRLTNEDFIQDLNLFDDLKLRASYGLTGNPGLSPGASLSRLSHAGNNYILGTDQTVASGIAANTLGNANLRWESTKQLNVGIDAEFFNNRLQLTIDYYDKLTEDLLVEVPLLWLTGFASTLTNFGSVSNKGIELFIKSVNIHRGDFLWETNFNISSNRNNVERIHAPEGYILVNPIGTGIDFPSGIIQEGRPIGSFHGLVQDRIWNSQAEIDESGLSGFSVFPGGKRYKDLNGDGVISSSDDRQVIGNAIPDFYGGIGNSFYYKGFELYAFLSFSYGNKIFNQTGSILGVAFDNNVYAKFADRWTPDNTDTNIPSVEGIRRPMITSNTGFVEDGSFLRLRDIRITYSLPVNFTPWTRSAKVYMSGTNLFTIDNYSGFDPEINRGFNNTRRGYDVSQDPLVKSITIGLELDF